MKPILITLAATAALLAQAPDMKSASGYARTLQSTLRKNVEKAAEKMPEESYGFKPSHDVRSFGELIGHIANAEYNMCAGVAAEKNPNTVNIEKDKKTKAELTEALKGAFAYCEKVYATATDASATETVKYGNTDRNKLGLMWYNNTHTNEHYGNLVTYMRIRGLVPPSSER